MRKTLYCIAVLLACNTLAQAQRCTAAFLDRKMVVNEYSTSGKCVVPSSANGLLSVWTVELGENTTKALDKIGFRVAIKDQQSKQVKAFSSKTYQQLDIREVLKQCKKGDRIVLKVTAKGYDLPHNEILVQ